MTGGTTLTKLELIAAAIGHEIPLTGVVPKRAWMRAARKAVEAMRDPGREAIEVGNTVSENAGDVWDPSHGCSHVGPQCGLEVWQAMIDAILNETEGE